MPREKPHINVVFIGHVDHGKSTTVGRLKYDLGLIPESELEKIREEAKKYGKEEFVFAYLMDRQKEERARGVTIDIAHTELETPHNYITIVDAPGHKDFVKNMITGASQADAAVLVVAADDGVQEQTQEHAVLARTFGINQIIVYINKMDKVNYDQKRFEEVKNQVLKLLKMIGYKDENIIAVIPGASFHGDNVVKKSDKMPWYNGPTLYEALDMLKPPQLPVDLPLRIPIQSALSIKGIGTVLTGRVETGKLKPGDKIIVLPSKKPNGAIGEVKSIEMHHKPLEEALPGDNIGFSVRGIEKGDVMRGDVAGHLDNPPTVAEEIVALIHVIYHPSAITVGYAPVLHVHTAHVPVRFEELRGKVNPATGQVIEENPQALRPGEAAVVKLKPLKPVVIEPFDKIPQLGRFAIRDMGRTVAIGIARQVTPKQIEIKK
ncbi:NEQ082 [Nanoarchaeum equitans Kin4-M]|uniref:Elongation factor 1-alpha n=1 Tax=Nanoarchaeum equitans (strain Kin4-M) TaxID=228908 RepID=EF1A_NANEQ|nr:RecName: Full=Elongation factor 1-alpha; Short=EF-1-alpha; AltName: Full=Elongation factor Tu; Short=EF-Tu [Nanoarchaeum equitans Kin4-M]AAR38938.1 NEQ082 [Nanoarchaeum equitans Kin4-M]